MAAREDISEILDAIRDVEKSLDARLARTKGALMIMWGVVVAVICVFYQLVTWNPAPYEAAFGGLLGWVWVGPTLVGYAASALAGARVMRGAASPRARREKFADLAPAFVSSAIAAILVVTHHAERIAGALLVGFAVTTLLYSRRGRGVFRRAAVGGSILCTLAGLALLVWPTEWQWLVCAVIFGGALIVLGRWQMMRAE